MPQTAGIPILLDRGNRHRRRVERVVAVVLAFDGVNYLLDGEKDLIYTKHNIVYNY